MKIFFLPLICLFILGCNQTDTSSQEKIASLTQELEEAKKMIALSNDDETAFIHTVFFWFNEGVAEADHADFAKNGLEALMGIPSIYKGYYGPPAMTPREEVVDNSYDFALICHFKSAADQDLYQEDPIHLKFIEDYKHLWKRVQVYDNLLSE